MKNIIKIEMILDYIKDNKLSKKDFCKNCGITLYNLNKILNNKLRIKCIIIAKICKYMKISSDVLLGLKKTSRKI